MPTGVEQLRTRNPQLMLIPKVRRLRAARYTLTLTWTGRHHQRHTTRQTVTLS
jgi:hypothetical protein